MAATLALGILIGAVLGLTGAGGGILAVPALVFGMGWTMQQAAPVALIAVAAGAAVGAFEGLRRKLVRYRAALLMAAAGMLVTPLGFVVAHALPQRWLTALFALVMLIAASRLLGRAGAAAQPRGRVLARLNPDTGRFDWNAPAVGLLGAIGAVTGLMTGLLGVGGGFVMVPLLRRFTTMSMQGIVATSLLVIALVGAAGALGAWMHGGPASPGIALWFAAATAAGMLAGRLLVRRLDERQVQRGFAAVLAAVAGGLLVKAVWFA